VGTDADRFERWKLGASIAHRHANTACHAVGCAALLGSDNPLSKRAKSMARWGARRQFARGSIPTRVSTGLVTACPCGCRAVCDAKPCVELRASERDRLPFNGAVARIGAAPTAPERRASGSRSARSASFSFDECCGWLGLDGQRPAGGACRRHAPDKRSLRRDLWSGWQPRASTRVFRTISTTARIWSKPGFESGERGSTNQLGHARDVFPELDDKIDRLDRIYIFTYFDGGDPATTFGLVANNGIESDLYQFLRDSH
jgi:hypothetical protein